jgi:hypothetical protein
MTQLISVFFCNFSLRALQMLDASIPVSHPVTDGACSYDDVALRNVRTMLTLTVGVRKLMKYEYMGVETQEESCSSTDAENKWVATLLLTTLTKSRILLSPRCISWHYYDPPRKCRNTSLK